MTSGCTCLVRSVLCWSVRSLLPGAGGFGANDISSNLFRVSTSSWQWSDDLTVVRDPQLVSQRAGYAADFWNGQVSCRPRAALRLRQACDALQRLQWLLHGGYQDPDNPYSSMIAFDVALLAWSPFTTGAGGPSARYLHTMVVIADTVRVLAARFCSCTCSCSCACAERRDLDLGALLARRRTCLEAWCRRWALTSATCTRSICRRGNGGS